MNKKYTVNHVFNEKGITFNELITNFLVSFLDRPLNLYESNEINID